MYRRVLLVSALIFLLPSFLFAQEGMSGYQNPTMDDNGDGIYQTDVDGAIAATIQVGATRLAGKDVPNNGDESG